MTNKFGVWTRLRRAFVSIQVCLITLTCFITVTTYVHAQSTETPSSYAADSTIPAFDVVSIKQHKSVDIDVGFRSTTDGISMSNLPMRMLLHEAFGVENDRIFGAPEWVKTTRYDIEAKVAASDISRSEKLTSEQRRLMICQLLQDRFGLKLHHEEKEIPMSRAE